MHKHTFILKQHTPLIHFQHEQKGATLRASEVKPRLDRFLIEKLGNGNYEKGKAITREKNWLLDKDKGALNYKLHIKQAEKLFSGEIQPIEYDNNGEIVRRDNKIKTKQFPGYFGNTGKEIDTELKWFRWGEDFKADVFVQDEFLYTYIKTHFPEFIFFTNFGSRSGKGFGSFTVIDDDKKSIIPQVLPKYHFKITVNSRTNSVERIKERYNSFYPDFNLNDYQFQYLVQTRELFNYLELFYKSLRSGINIPYRRETPNPCVNDSRFYFKSFLFSYFKSKDIQWDKKTIKEHFYFSRNPNHCLPKQKVINTDPNNPLNYIDSLAIDNKMLIRDLLGLSLLQDWQSYHNDKIHKESVDKVNREPKYARFKSPIDFKPIRNQENNDGEDNVFNVYIIPGHFPNELKGKRFEITSEKRGINGVLYLSYPKDFDINDYLYYVFEKKNENNEFIINLSEYVNYGQNKDFTKQIEFIRLQEMFNQIRKIIND